MCPVESGATTARPARARTVGAGAREGGTARDAGSNVVGGPRRVRLAGGQPEILGDTVDFVMKHETCRVMVAAAKDPEG